MKNVAVSTEDGAFAVFSRPHPWEFAIQGKTEKGVGGGGGLNSPRYDLKASHSLLRSSKFFSFCLGGVICWNSFYLQRYDSNIQFFKPSPLGYRQVAP